MPKCQTWVVKLGGSLIGSAALSQWLIGLRRAARSHRIVVVTGGGPFADAVRDTQSALGVSDRTAHSMAVQGMRQFALAVAAVEGCAALVNVKDIVSQEAAGFYVWDPLDDSLVDSALPPDWTATSDSIAVWLANRLAATGGVLVKSRSPRVTNGDAALLAAESFIDAHLPVLLQGQSVPLWWFDNEGVGAYERLLVGEEMPGNEIKASRGR